MELYVTSILWMELCVTYFPCHFHRILNATVEEDFGKVFNMSQTFGLFPEMNFIYIFF